MIGLDTNVLVRLLVADDPEQTAAAQRLLVEAKAAGEPLHLDGLVLAEAVWVLRRLYRADRDDISTAITALLNNSAYEIAERPLVEQALAAFGAGKADFADCLIASRNLAAGCRYTATFDDDAAALSGMRPV